MRIRRASNPASPSRRPTVDGRVAFEAEALASLDSLFRTARRLTRSPADAEDLVQKTYHRFSGGADQFRRATNLGAWFSPIRKTPARTRAGARPRGAFPADSEAVDRAADLPHLGP